MSEITLRLPRPQANPVLIKELRARFRSRRAFYTFTIFLGILALGAVLLYAAQRQATIQPGVGVWALGDSFVGWIMALELMLMAAIGPALTMNALSGERERRTYELLLATPLSGWAILRGKLLAAFAYVVLLAFAVLPIMSLAFVFGGVSATSMFKTQLSVLSTGLLFVSVGLFWSAWLKSSTRAAVGSYVTVAAVTFGPMLMIFLVSILSFLLTPFHAGPETAERLFTFVSLTSGPLAATMPLLGGGWAFGNSGATGTAALKALPLILSAILLILAGARIRPAGALPKLAFIGLVWLLAIWLGWAWHLAGTNSSGSMFFP